MRTDLSILSTRSTGLIMIIGLFVILILHVALLLSIPTTIGFVVFLFISVFFMHQPLWGFLSIVVIRASVDFLDSYFSFPITKTISLNVASLLALAIIAMMAFIIISNYKKFIYTPLIFSFSAFIFFSGISFIYSIDKGATFEETVRVISIFATFVLGYMFCVAIPTARKTIISTILFASILPMTFALFQLVTNTGFSDNTGTDGRLFGTFKHPNSFASFLIIIISLLTYRTFSTFEEATDRRSKTLLLALTIGLLILTFSRGGWFALIIFFGIFTLLRAPKVLFISIAIGIALFFVSPAIHDRIEDVYNPPADSSVRWRFQQWKNAISAWKLSPIYGYGAGTEIAIFEREQGFYAGNPYTHNDMIKVLQETGIIGFVLFLILIFTTLIRLIITHHKFPMGNDRLFILVVILLFIAEIGFGMSSNIWRSTAIQWFIWLLVACALSYRTPEKTFTISHK